MIKNASINPQFRAHTFCGEDYAMDMDENLDHRLPQTPSDSPFPQIFQMQAES